MNTRFGEMMDMLACLAIENGASYKAPKLTMEEVLELR